ncbi:MAG: class B sortase [Christensenellales bacterium]|jgi:sortase B
MMGKRNTGQRRIWFTVLIIIVSALIVFSAVMIATQLSEYSTGQKTYNRLQQYIKSGPGTSENPLKSVEEGQTDTVVSLPVPPIAPDFDALGEINEDVVGWIISEGTVIDYPVVHGIDNQHYLTHVFDGTRNKLGSIFVDFRNQKGFTDKNTIIHGHHMKNGSMFASLVEYRNQEYFEQHPVMWLLTPERNYLLEIVSGYVTNGDEAYNISFEDEEEFLEFAKTINRLSDFESNVEIGKDDRLITFSTCTYEMSNARYVIHAKLSPAG